MVQASAAPDRTLLAGAARVDSTPPVGIELFGYHRSSPMADVRDPLSITALALFDSAAAPAHPVVLLAADHIGMGLRATRSLREGVASAIGTTVERVIVCFSHTHSGPDSEALDWYGRERPPDALERIYGATLPVKAASAARLAMQRLAPACAGCGTADSGAGTNRRLRGPDSRAVMGVNPFGPVDRQVSVLRIDDAGGRPLASVVHYGIHGTVFRADNLACSADVAGGVRATVEAATVAPCLFVQGAAGDVNPRWRGDDSALRRVGWELGGAALRALESAEPRPLEVLEVASETLTMRLDPLPDESETVRRAEDVARIWDAPTGAWLDAVRRKLATGERQLTLPLEVHVLRVNGFTRAGIPMEPFAGLSLAFRERAARTSSRANNGTPVGVTESRTCFAFGGYTNGLIGYLPTAEEHAVGGYEIEWMPVVYGFYEGLLAPPAAETGAQVVDAATRLATGLPAGAADGADAPDRGGAANTNGSAHNVKSP